MFAKFQTRTNFTLADIAALDLFCNHPKMRSRPVLRSHIDNPVVLSGRVHHRPALANRQRSGFLDIHVLAGFTSHDCRNRVPVIRSGDVHGVHVLHLQHSPEIAKGLRISAGPLARSFRVFLIHIRRGYISDIGVFAHEFCDIAAPAAAADQGDTDLVIGAQHSGRRQSGRRKEVPAFHGAILSC
jgi:hypothetical protein